MYCRVIRLRGTPAKTDEAIKLWSHEILPTIKQQSGFAGATLVGNRETGEGLTVTYWETEQNMQAAKEHVRPVALKVLGTTGGSIVDDTECKVEVMERFQPAKAGAWVRMTTVKADAARLQEGAANFKANMLPALAQKPGVRSAFYFVSAQAGKIFGGSVWDTEKELQANEAAISDARRDAIKQIGGEDVTTETFEIYYTEIMAPAAAGR
ncbi:MAG TPA: antibiotic biosynthesis monooxygenase [Candidatus Dormibacteraeota bacterium]|jgi:heme-degrading monooxygenase HmoA